MGRSQGTIRVRGQAVCSRGSRPPGRRQYGRWPGNEPYSGLLAGAPGCSRLGQGWCCVPTAPPRRRPGPRARDLATRAMPLVGRGCAGAVAAVHQQVLTQGARRGRASAAGSGHGRSGAGGAGWSHCPIRMRGGRLPGPPSALPGVLPSTRPGLGSCVCVRRSSRSRGRMVPIERSWCPVARPASASSSSAYRSGPSVRSPAVRGSGRPCSRQGMATRGVHGRLVVLRISRTPGPTRLRGPIRRCRRTIPAVSSAWRRGPRQAGGRRPAGGPGPVR